MSSMLETKAQIEQKLSTPVESAQTISADIGFVIVLSFQAKSIRGGQNIGIHTFCSSLQLVGDDLSWQMTYRSSRRHAVTLFKQGSNELQEDGRTQFGRDVVDSNERLTSLCSRQLDTTRAS